MSGEKLKPDLATAKRAKMAAKSYVSPRTERDEAGVGAREDRFRCVFISVCLHPFLPSAQTKIASHI